MTDSTKKVPSSQQGLPKGMEFFEFLWGVENVCEAFSDAALPKMGKKAPDCFAKLGTLLSLLYQTACCAWGCEGSDHTVEYMIGRTVTCAMSAVRLMRFGYYDEALSLVRHVTEIANLLYLFDADQSLLAEWSALAPEQRRQRFSPVQVRLKLEAVRGSPLFDKDHYGLLCEVGAHVNPQTRPQAHNIENRPTLGAVFQEVGFLLVLNELATAAVAVAGGAARLCRLPVDIQREIAEAMRAVFDATGGIALQPMQDYWKTIRSAGGDH